MILTIVPTSIHQRECINRSHLTLTGHVPSRSRRPGNSDLPRYLYYTVRNISPGRRHPSDYPTDLLAFSLIIYLALRWRVYQLQMSGSLFRIIVEDATLYFLVIFTSHIVLEVFLIFMTVGILPSRSIFSLAYRDLCSLHSSCSLPCKRYYDPSLSLVHLIYSVEQREYCVRPNSYFFPRR